jgi:hypothetical protein
MMLGALDALDALDALAVFAFGRQSHASGSVASYCFPNEWKHVRVRLAHVVSIFLLMIIISDVDHWK